jgi:transposase
VGARRDFEALRRRRMQAADMFDRGKRQVDVAAKLGISQPTASRWYQSWLAGGRAALAGAGRAGRMRKLTAEQLARWRRRW